MSEKEIDMLILELFSQLSADEKKDVIRFAEKIKTTPLQRGSQERE